MRNPEEFYPSRPLTDEEAKQRLDQLITDVTTLRTKQDEIIAAQTRIEQKTDEIRTRVDTIDENTRSRTPPA